MRKGQLLVGVQFVCLAVIIFFPGRDVGRAASAVATLLELVAAIILILGFFNLRESLKITPEPKANSKFVTNGIYKYIRHPIYSGLIIFAIAEVINKQSLSILLATLILIIDLAVKFNYEDQLLRDLYPEAAEYQKKVGALFPRLW